jgi:hypothetical protein
MSEMGNAYKIFVGKLEGTRPLGRPPRGWDDNNNKVDLSEIECGDMNWVQLAQDRTPLPAVVNTIINLRLP